MNDGTDCTLIKFAFGAKFKIMPDPFRRTLKSLAHKHPNEVQQKTCMWWGETSSRSTDGRLTGWKASLKKVIGDSSGQHTYHESVLWLCGKGDQRKALPAGHKRDPSALLSTGETHLQCWAQLWHPCTRETQTYPSKVKGHKDVKAITASLIWQHTERTRAVRSERRRLMGILSIYINICGNAAGCKGDCARLILAMPREDSRQWAQTDYKEVAFSLRPLNFAHTPTISPAQQYRIV